MVVVRDIFRLKFGQSKEAMALWKEAAAAARSSGYGTAGFRLLTADRVVWSPRVYWNDGARRKFPILPPLRDSPVLACLPGTYVPGFPVLPLCGSTISGA